MTFNWRDGALSWLLAAMFLAIAVINDATGWMALLSYTTPALWVLVGFLKATSVVSPDVQVETAPSDSAANGQG